MAEKNTSLGHCKIRCSDEAMGLASANVVEFTFLLKNSRPEAHLLKSGAKAFWQGGGWWHIMGYAHDASDTIQSLEIIRSVSERNNTLMQATAYDPMN